MFRRIKKHLLYIIDKAAYRFLYKNRDIMPLRIKKLLAVSFPDARIRKLYLEYFGIFMDENSYSNLGLVAVIGEKKEKYMVHIGRNVSIAPNVVFICDSNPNNSIFLREIAYVKDYLIKNEKIIVEDDVWIGANVTILPGVTIKKGSIIGAGSVLTKDTEQYSIYAGVPAKQIRKLDISETISTQDNNNF